VSDTEPRDETVVEEPQETVVDEPAAVPEVAEVAETTETPAASRGHGWVSLYLVAFALLLVSGLSVGLAARSFLQSLAPLYLSIALSVVAAILAVMALVLPKRS
jgi:hypothetical protein